MMEPDAGHIVKRITTNPPARVCRATFRSMARTRKRASNPLLAIAYLRVSTEDQTVNQQRDAIEAWAKQHGITVVAWFADEGVSGAAPVEARPALLEAMAELKSSNAGLLVAAKRDRLARDVATATVIERLATEAGAKVVTSDGLDASNTPEGQLVRTLMDAIAQYELSLIRARTRVALASKKKRGEAVGSAPYGWRNLGRIEVQGGKSVGGRLEAVPEEQAAIVRIRLLQAAGISHKGIAQALTTEGYRARGRAWHATTVQRVLSALRAA